MEGFAHARDKVREKKRTDSFIQSGSTFRGQCSCAQVVLVQQLLSAAISFVHLIFNILRLKCVENIGVSIIFANAVSDSRQLNHVSHSTDGQRRHQHGPAAAAGAEPKVGPTMPTPALQVPTRQVST